MVKRIDDDSLLDIEHPKMFLEAMRFVDKNCTPSAPCGPTSLIA